MKQTVKKKLAAQAIGLEILNYLAAENCIKTIFSETESKAMQILEEIRCVLDDEALNDRECFQRIESIVSVFEANGLDTTRHDW